MFKKSVLFLFSLLMLLSISFCGGDKKGGNGGKKGDADLDITKEAYIAYIKEVIEYYKTEEYQTMAKKYKEEAKGVKKLMERQKIWEKHMIPSKNKVLEIQKAHNLDVSKLFKCNDKYGKDPEVQKFIFEMARYVVF